MTPQRGGQADYDDPRREISTPEFLHEQIAKGGGRGYGRQRTGHGSSASASSLPEMRVCDTIQAVASRVSVRASDPSDPSAPHQPGSSQSALDGPWWMRTANRRALHSGTQETASHKAVVRKGPLPPHDWTQHHLGDAALARSLRNGDNADDLIGSVRFCVYWLALVGPVTA